DRSAWRRGAKLPTYAFPWIRHAILDAPLARRRRDQLTTSLHETGQLECVDSTVPDPLQSLIDRTPVIDVDAALRRLPDRSRRVIELRYGLRDGLARTADAVAAELGVARERVRTIELHGLRRLASLPVA